MNMTMKELGKGQDDRAILFKSTGCGEYGFVIVEGKKAVGSFFVNSKEEMKSILEKAYIELEDD